MNNRRVAERMLGDLCFMSHGGLWNIQKSRLRFQTILSFQSETRILQEKLQAAAQAQQRRLKPDVLSRAGFAPTEVEQVIELPVELFENPHDSVLHLGDDFRPEYAGYYGNCSKEQILHFFGDYLPMYEDGSMKIKKIVAEVCASNQHSMNSDAEQSREPMQPSEEDYKLTSTPIRAFSQKSMSTINFSSTLESIFRTDEEEIRLDYAKNIEGDAKCKSDESISMGTVERFLPAFKLDELYVDTLRSEVNFQHFLSLYRPSLNLLNECQ